MSATALHDLAHGVTRRRFRSNRCGCPSRPNRVFKRAPAAAGIGQGHALHHGRRTEDPRRRGGPLVRERRAMDESRSSRRFGLRPQSWITRPRSRWDTRWRSSLRLAGSRQDCPVTSITCSLSNSGSEAVDTALKIALAYHQARGDVRRTRFVGRSRGYHGVGFGGISVGGMENNRRQFPTLLPAVSTPARHARRITQRVLPGPARPWC